jgi:hypothetical protein
VIQEVVLRPKTEGCDIFVLMEDGWHHKRCESTVSAFGMDLFERIFRGYYEDWIPAKWPMKKPSEKPNEA